MLLNRGKNKKKSLGPKALAAGIAIVLVALFLWVRADKNPIPPPAAVPAAKGTAVTADKAAPEKETAENRVITGEIRDEKAIDYKDLAQEGEQKTLMDDRKKSLGIKESLDMIVKSDESFIVGDSKVSMQTILEQAFTKEGKVYEQELTESGQTKPTEIKAYGIRVVKPGENLWNIHFSILRDYYAAKGIRVETKADEPGSAGLSSGVGKILKFSETMVIIYNMVEGKVVKDINLLEPLSKVVVYNMEAVFNLLAGINYENVDRIQFDGRNIWIPAKKS